jgi:CheY-like chemotaxis protein
VQPLFREDQKEFDILLPAILEELGEWQILSVALTERSNVPYDEVIAKILDTYNGCAGVTYNMGYFRVVALVKMGRVKNYALARSQFLKRLPAADMHVVLRRLTKPALDYLQKTYCAQDAAPPEPYEDRCARGHGKVLIADDDTIIRIVMKKILEGRASVLEASTGEKALDMVAQHNPDMIFLDIHMPGGGGLDAIEKIFDRDPHACVVMLSADKAQEKIIEAVTKGASGFIAKPLQKDKVLSYVGKCVTLGEALSKAVGSGNGE